MRTLKILSIIYLITALATAVTLDTLYPHGSSTHWPIIGILSIAWPVTWIAAIPFHDDI